MSSCQSLRGVNGSQDERWWSARQVDRKLDHSDCVVRRCWDQWIREMSFTRKPGSGRTRQISREDRYIVRNAHEQPTASSAAIQAQVAPLLGAPVSSRTIRRHLSEGHLGSRRPLRVLPLTPTHRHLHLEWCRARGNWTAAEWRDDSIFNLSSDDNRIRVWRPLGKRLNPVFALQRQTVPTAGVMVSQDFLRTVTTLPWPARSPELSPIQHIWDQLGQRVGHPTSLNEDGIWLNMDSKHGV
ncbi:transposable element Tcb2 transposase [Trichonephila clavipes]|nr:transposable element Tcb2 transposase [Trichonephila clavipes]